MIGQYRTPIAPESRPDLVRGIVISEVAVVVTETPGDLREALFHASFTPHRERNHAWWEYLDKILDQLSACNK